MKLWEVGAGKCLRTLQGHGNPVWSMTFSPNGRILASSSDDETIRLWDVATGSYLQVIDGASGLGTCGLRE